MLLSLITGASFILSALLFLVLDVQLLLIPAVFVLLWLGLGLLAFLFMCLICALVDLDKVQEHDSPFYRQAMYLYIGALKTLVGLKITTEGLEKTPKEGRFLLVCNHQNESDPGILLHYFRKSQLAFVSKQENRNMFAVGKFMHKTMCQMVNRENDREALKTILRCIQLIREDETSVAIFPEGGILVRDKLSRFRPGVFKIAMKTGVPIVVCTLKGTSALFENMKKLKTTPVHLHLVDVISPEEYAGKTTVELAQQVHGMMLQSLGEEYRLEE